MFWFLWILVTGIAGVAGYLLRNWAPPIIVGILSVIIIVVGVNIDIESQKADTEMWSGTITAIKHVEEWDEWHPPRDETYTTTDSDGNTTTHTIHHPGYWEHHYATNHITTSDAGTMSVSQSPDGKKFTDDFVNNDKELSVYYWIGKPSASFHTYENRIKASYSIFREHNVDEEQYPNLPEWPNTLSNYIDIDRAVGFNGILSTKSQTLLAQTNAELNKTIDDPEKPGKKRAWKQANLIFVNLGDNEPLERGWALQNKWRNGAKNDIVIAVSRNSAGEIVWSHSFAWSDSREFLENIKTYLRGKPLTNDEEFAEILQYVQSAVERGFERTPFATFNYLKIECTPKTTTVLWWVCIILMLIACFGTWYYEENY